MSPKSLRERKPQARACKAYNTEQTNVYRHNQLGQHIKPKGAQARRKLYVADEQGRVDASGRARGLGGPSLRCRGSSRPWGSSSSGCGRAARTRLGRSWEERCARPCHPAPYPFERRGNATSPSPSCASARRRVLLRPPVLRTGAAPRCARRAAAPPLRGPWSTLRMVLLCTSTIIGYYTIE